LIPNKTFAIFAGLVLTCAAQCGAQIAVPVSTAADSTVSASKVVAALALASPDQPISSDAAATDASAPAGDWHFSVSPYLWLPGVHGGIGVNSTQIVGIHASAGDLLSHFRFGLMGVVEPRYKRASLF
jgi:hypothetical protein